MNPAIIILMYIYPLVCVFVPCLIYQLVLSKHRDNYFKINKGNLIWRYVLILYLYMVMYVVGIGSIWEIGQHGSIFRADEINLQLFNSQGSITYILNVVMLIPLGFLLPFIWVKYRNLPKVLLTGFLFSFCIEFGQLFNRRVSDVDDLLMNVLGAGLGFVIWVIFDRIFNRKPKEKNIFKDNPLAYILLTLGGIFFLYNWRWFMF